jgi:hypothetical protein
MKWMPSAPTVAENWYDARAARQSQRRHEATLRDIAEVIYAEVKDGLHSNLYVGSTR